MRRAGYEADDTGERVTTDAGLDTEALVTLRVPADACITEAQRVHALVRA